MTTKNNTQPTVKQFMSQILITCSDTTPVQDAAQFIVGRKLTTVPVVSNSGEVIGVLTDFHLLRGLLRMRQETHIKVLGDLRDELDPVVTVHENDSIVDAFRLMIQSPSHRIYVLHGGKLVGAVSPKDLLLYMAGIRSTTEPAMDSIVQKQVEAILKELHETRQQLSEYQQMFRDSPYLMHSVDLHGKIIAANRMIHYVLGYNDGELVGRTLRDLYPPENYAKAMEGLETVKKLGYHPLVNVVMKKKDGELVRIDVASTVRKDEKGQPEGTITVGRLSDSYRMLNFLQRAAQAK